MAPRKQKRGRHSQSGERLRAVRGDRKQKDFADAIGISQAALSQLESGATAPSAMTLMRIHERFGVQPEAILGAPTSEEILEKGHSALMRTLPDKLRSGVQTLVTMMAIDAPMRAPARAAFLKFREELARSQSGAVKTWAASPIARAAEELAKYPPAELVSDAAIRIRGFNAQQAYDELTNEQQLVLDVVALMLLRREIHSTTVLELLEALLVANPADREAVYAQLKMIRDALVHRRPAAHK